MFNNFYQKYFIRPIDSLIKHGLATQEHRFIHALEMIKMQNGRILTNQMLSNSSITNIHDAEFKIFSQWGDDGIIQYIINKVDVKNKIFIEFGVQDYLESNTRFLLMNNNWKGLIMDSGEKYMNSVKGDGLYWRHDITAVCAFITVENVDSLFTTNGFKGNVGGRNRRLMSASA